MTAIRAGMSTSQVLAAMAGGNTEAWKILCQMYQQEPTVDPYNQAGPLSSIYRLDGMGICGEQICAFYANVADRSIVKMLAVLRAIQMGLVSEQDVQDAHQLRGTALQMGCWAGINPDSVLAKVQARLPEFGKSA